MSVDSDSPRSRRAPRAFLAAICTVAIASFGVGIFAERIASSTILFYLVKFGWARAAPAADVLVVGASQSVAGIRPDVLEKALPAGTRVANYAVPALSPCGAYALLRTYLEHHDPPALVVISYTPLFYTDRLDSFEKYTIPHALGASDVVRAAWLDRSPSYLLSWLGARVPAVRYRDGLQAWLGSQALDALPLLQEPLREWIGLGATPQERYRFQWKYRERLARNAKLAAELEESGGWHYWKENEMPGIRAALKAQKKHKSGFVQRGGAQALPVVPFELSPREADAMRRILRLCAEQGINVQLLASPMGSWMAAILSRGEGGTRLASWWDAISSESHVRAIDEPLVVYPMTLFGDPLHLGPAGAQRYSAEIAPIVAAAYREALERRDTSSSASILKGPVAAR